MSLSDAAGIASKGKGEVGVVFSASSWQVPATARRAASKAGGKIRPRRAARRRIPRQARGESQYFRAASGSNTSRSEQAENPASLLGQSEVSSINSCPCSSVPEAVQVS